MTIHWKPARPLQVNEKHCFNCGRIGARDFVKYGGDDGPEWMGPWKCKWDGPCWKRSERQRQAEEAQQPQPPDPIDLDALQAEIEED